MGEMIRNEIHSLSGDLSKDGRQWDPQRVPLTYHPNHVEKLAKRNILPAQDVTFSHPPSLHGEDETGGNIADVHKVENEIDIQLDTSVEKIVQHRGRRRQPAMWAYRHGRIGDHDG